jgi:hypothetical protein
MCSNRSCLTFSLQELLAQGQELPDQALQVLALPEQRPAWLTLVALQVPALYLALSPQAASLARVQCRRVASSVQESFPGLLRAHSQVY